MGAARSHLSLSTLYWYNPTDFINVGSMVMSTTITHIILLIFQGLLIAVLSPLTMGWIKRVKCRLQNRSAPSVFQPYQNFYKLLIKQPVLAENASWLFRFVPYIYFVTLILVCFSLPFFITKTLSSQIMDTIVIVGLLGLARIFLALAAMDVGTAFGSMGSRREMFIACLAEPILLITFFNLALLTHSAFLSASSAFFIGHFTLYPSLVFSFIALILVAIAETGRVPIDNPATHLELTMIHEAMILEYSGRYLALIEWGNAIKFTLYLGFIAALFIPFGLSTHYQFKAIMLGLLTTFVKFSFLATFIGIIESINSKLRLFKVPDYLAGAFMLAVLGVLITQISRAVQ